MIKIKQLIKKAETETGAESETETETETQLLKPKTLKADKEKFDDNFRIHLTQEPNCFPETGIDLQYMMDVIKATDGCSDKKRYLTSPLLSTV